MVELMSKLVDTIEEIANDPKLPASITDWASIMYNKLTDKDASVQVKDLLILTAIIEDREYGLHLLDIRLQETT